jgi:hypothetical protein
MWKCGNVEMWKCGNVEFKNLKMENNEFKYKPNYHGAFFTF